MIREIEWKILEVWYEDIEKKCKDIWAQLDFFHERFHAVWVGNTQGIRFRIRQEGGLWVLMEYKNPIKTFMWWDMSGNEESGLSIKSISEWQKDLEAALEFATRIGFQKIGETIKYRTQWILEQNIKIAHDTFESVRWFRDIPSLIEIESFSEIYVRGWVDLLGYTQANLKKMSETDLLRHYGKI